MVASLTCNYRRPAQFDDCINSTSAPSAPSCEIRLQAVRQMAMVLRREQTPSFIGLCRTACGRRISCRVISAQRMCPEDSSIPNMPDKLRNDNCPVLMKERKRRYCSCQGLPLLSSRNRIRVGPAAACQLANDAAARSNHAAKGQRRGEARRGRRPALSCCINKHNTIPAITSLNNSTHSIHFIEIITILLGALVAYLASLKPYICQYCRSVSHQRQLP